VRSLPFICDVRSIIHASASCSPALCLVRAVRYDNGDVKMLDLRTNKIRWEDNVKSGVCAWLLSIVLMWLIASFVALSTQIVGLEFDRKDIQMNKLVCTTLESRSGLIF
jgi:hypothetical protein